MPRKDPRFHRCRLLRVFDVDVVFVFFSESFWLPQIIEKHTHARTQRFVVTSGGRSPRSHAASDVRVLESSPWQYTVAHGRIWGRGRERERRCGLRETTIAPTIGRCENVRRVLKHAFVCLLARGGEKGGRGGGGLFVGNVAFGHGWTSKALCLSHCKQESFSVCGRCARAEGGGVTL